MTHRLNDKTFSVKIDNKRVLFDEYIKLCKKYGINYSTVWNGSGTYYGIKYEDSNNVKFYPLANPDAFGDHIFNTIEEFQNFLKPNINDFSII